MKAHNTTWRCTLHFGFPVTHLLRENSNTYKVLLKTYLPKEMYWSLASHSDNGVTILLLLILSSFCSHYREKPLLSRKNHKIFIKWLGLCVGNLQSHKGNHQERQNENARECTAKCQTKWDNNLIMRLWAQNHWAWTRVNTVRFTDVSWNNAWAFI